MNFLILTLAILIYFRRLFYPESSLFMIPDFGESDVLHLNLPLKDLLANSLKNGQFPLWTPLLASGFPITAEGQIGTFYLPNLLFFRFLPTVLAYNLSLVSSFVFLACGTYLFAREFNFSKLTSIFTSLVFTFSGFFSVHLNHLNLLQTASLMPFAFWAVHRLWKKPNLKRAVLFSFVVSQEVFAGYLTILFVSLVGIFLFYLILKTSFKKWFYFLISIVFASLLSAIQLLPTFELWRLSGRSEGLDFGAVTAYPYPPRHLLTFLNPYFFGDPGLGTYPAFNSDWGIFWENTAYVGILPLILALASLFFYKDRRVFIFLLLAAFSLLLVLGKYSPLYFIFSFPPFNLFRVPSRYLLITAWSVSLLSAITLEKILKSRYRLLIFIFVLTLIFLDEYRFSYNYPPVSPSSWWTQKPKTVRELETQGAVKIATIGAPEAWNSVFLAYGWQDIRAYKSFTNALYPNQNLLFKLATYDVNTGGLIPRRLALFRELGREGTSSALAKNTLSIAGVTHLITPNIYKNEKASPRSYIAYKSRKVETTQDIVRQLSREDFLSQNTVLVETDSPELESGEPASFDPVSIISSKDQEVILEAKAKKAGILVLNDTYYPGWHASLDGKKTEIFPVNLNLRGILIPEGQHQIRFWYESKYFTSGRLITILALFLIPFLTLRKVSGNSQPGLFVYNRRRN